MDIEAKLRELVDKLFINTGATFSGIFIDEKTTVLKTVYTEKKEKLEEILKLIIYKAHQINEFIEDFGEEYVYAEGDDISIFIYFVRPDIAVASIIEEKPKFALLKLEHTTIAKKIKEIESEIDQFIKGEIPKQDKKEEKEDSLEDVELENLEEVIPELKEEPSLEIDEGKTEITVEDIRDRYAEEMQQLEEAEDIEELEKVLSENQEPSLEEILKSQEEIKETEGSEEKTEEKTEEKKERDEITETIVEKQTEEELYDPEVLEQIQKELLKEIGPVGKFLFRKRKKELNIQEDKLTRTALVMLIEKLSDDIIDEKRKQRFLEKVSAFV